MHRPLFGHVGLIVLACWLVLPPSFSRGAEERPPAGVKEAGPPAEAASGAAGEERLSVTRHAMDVEGRRIEYTATAGRLTLSDDEGKAKAHMFFTSYEVGGPAGRPGRPVTFVFNGGPGAASIFLHMAALGPVRILFNEEGKPSAPPYGWEPNPATWLSFTDLVFIDPVGTGYSRPAAGVKADEFLGLQEDIHWTASFIIAYCTRFDRWLSPKFIAGESYGTTRAAGLSGYLEMQGLNVNGLMLISPVLDFQTIVFAEGNDLPYVLYLPAYACAAAFHKKSAAPLSPGEARAQAERFALDGYRSALMKGDALSPEERESVVEGLAGMTGLSKTYVRNANLRVKRDDFLTELLRDEHRTVSVIDSRMTAAYEVKGFLDDPGLFYLLGPLAAGWNDYAKKTLGYESSLPYEVLSHSVSRSWRWGSASRGYVDVAGTLAQAMKRDRFMKVFMAGGYYDLDTSYFATAYTVDHLGLDAGLRSNITIAYYPAGHQMYTDTASLGRLRADVRAFVERSLGPQAH